MKTTTIIQEEEEKNVQIVSNIEIVSTNAALNADNVRLLLQYNNNLSYDQIRMVSLVINDISMIMKKLRSIEPETVLRIRNDINEEGNFDIRRVRRGASENYQLRTEEGS
jgi:hypothetical protein